MDLVSKSHSIHHISQALSPITTPFRTTSSLHHPNDTNSFPIIAIAIIGILATAFLLVSYYIFVIRCCLNWHRIDILRRFSLSTNRSSSEELLMAYSPGSLQTRGLEESVIRSIPVIHYKKVVETQMKDDDDDSNDAEAKFSECAVCLNEFRDDEKLRIIPNCLHMFHIDCIDVWLQNNANCPLCRTSVSGGCCGGANGFHCDPFIAPASSPIDPDEDYVVIELSNIDTNSGIRTDQIRTNARAREAATPVAAAEAANNNSPRKLENNNNLKKIRRKFFGKGTSMGDECIDMRPEKDKDEVFAVQPIRRSFSMDSSADRKMFLAIPEAVRHSRQVSNVSNSNEVIMSVISPNINEDCSTSGSSNNNRVKRSFFSFGHGRGNSSRISAVLPVYLEA